MIIKSIEISNFLTYYEPTEFEFSEGATIIIGQNNTGKSKLFDAYNWVLYNEAYRTESESWYSTAVWKEDLLNRFAKSSCQVGSKIEASVTLTFQDEKMDNYMVSRTYRIARLTETVWDCANDSELSITKKNASTYNSEYFNGNQATDLLKIFFPKNLSRYFLFQGESISKLLRLNHRTDFTKAIGELSGIKYFEKAKQYADKIYKKSKELFDKEEDSDAGVQEAKIKLIKEVKEAEEKLNDLTENLDNEIKEKDKKEEKLTEKESELSRYEECARLLQDIRELERQIAEKSESRVKLFEYNRSDLMNSWIYGKSNILFNEFLSLYRKAIEDSKIPEPIRQDFIKEMILAHQCRVCGTPAPEGSSQFRIISGYLNEKALDKEVAVINTLSDAAGSILSVIDSLPEQLNAFLNSSTAIQESIEFIRTQILTKEDELRIVSERIEEEQQGLKIDRSILEKINLTQLTKDRDKIKADLDKSRMKIELLAGRIEEAKNSLEKVTEEFNELIKKSSNRFARERMSLASDLKDEIYLIHDSFIRNLISDIEIEANHYFENMTRSNPALSGKVRVDFDKHEVYTVDELGEQMTNINQANKVSLQISFVAAVLTVSNKIWDKHFPFVADAPISALDGNNKISAIKTMTDIFRQSIIILKDDADPENSESLKSDQVRLLIKNNSKVRHAYQLRMVGETMNEQRTKVTTLK